jgi:hypothetical protein
LMCALDVTCAFIVCTIMKAWTGIQKGFIKITSASPSCYG